MLNKFAVEELVMGTERMEPHHTTIYVDSFVTLQWRILIELAISFLVKQEVFLPCLSKLVQQNKNHHLRFRDRAHLPVILLMKRMWDLW